MDKTRYVKGNDEALLITREYSSLENDAQVKFNNKLLDSIAKSIYE